MIYTAECTKSSITLLIVPQQEIDSTIFRICSNNDTKERALL